MSPCGEKKKKAPLHGGMLLLQPLSLISLHNQGTCAAFRVCKAAVCGANNLLDDDQNVELG